VRYDIYIYIYMSYRKGLSIVRFVDFANVMCFKINESNKKKYWAG
jgi:hypothetical protein